MSWHETCRDSIRRTSFPFAYREGQKELAAAVYRSIVREKLLFIQAPTGSGKTLSTLFPAVKAVGEGKGGKIFYLTARTIARMAAMEAMDQLRGQGLRMKSIVLTAKEKICPLSEPSCNPDDCPYAKGHFDRVNDAVFELLKEGGLFTAERLLAAAEKAGVCPYEFALDVSVWCDTVIADYNYAFDPRVRLRRYFSEGTGGDYIFLVDEAHNLPDRASEMYSASLVKEDVLALKKLIMKIEDDEIYGKFLKDAQAQGYLMGIFEPSKCDWPRDIVSLCFDKKIVIFPANILKKDLMLIFLTT